MGSKLTSLTSIDRLMKLQNLTPPCFNLEISPESEIATDYAVSVEKFSVLITANATLLHFFDWSVFVVLPLLPLLVLVIVIY